MTDIPADIQETARDLASDWAMPETEETCAGSIALALLAERERCAKIVESRSPLWEEAEAAAKAIRASS